MQTCYKMEGLTHYFVVLTEYPIRFSYESRLFANAAIPEFLPLEVREMNGRQALYFRMDYRVSMREASGHLKVSYGKLKRMTGDIIAAIETAESYLLEPECIVWNPDAIFMDPESGRLHFCYVPADETGSHAAQEAQPENAEETDCSAAQEAQPENAEETDRSAEQEKQTWFVNEAETGQKGQGRFRKSELPELLQEAAVVLLQMADRRDGEGVQWSRRFYDLVTGDCTLEELVRFQQGEEKLKVRLPVEQEEPYVVQELPFQGTQETQGNSRFETIVKYGMAASAIWSAVVLLGLLTGLAPDAWVSGLMGGLAVLIVLSLLSMQLYREDSPEEIMRDYFSENMSGGYGGWNGQAKQDRFTEPAGINMRQTGSAGMKIGQKESVKPDGTKTGVSGFTGPERRNMRQAAYTEPGEMKKRETGYSEPEEMEKWETGYSEPEGMKMYQTGFAEAGRILREPNRYGEAGITTNPYPEAEEVMGLEDIPTDSSARQLAEGMHGQTVLLQGEVTGQEVEGSLYLRSAEQGRYPDVRAGDRGIVLGCLEDACDYILKERGVSRMHAKLLRRKNGLYLMDLNSTNGTYVNGARIESGKEYPLAEGDVVAFARCEFVTVHA